MKNKENSSLIKFPQSIYFEREPLVKDLAEQLLNDFLVVVTGANGSGKSTLVKTSLCTDLVSGNIIGRAGTDWRIVQTKPFADPIGNLINDLIKPYANSKENSFYPPGTLDTTVREQLTTRLREESNVLENLYNERRAQSKEKFNLLIIVDQLEELFRYQSFISDYGHAGDDSRYINLLLNASRSNAPVYIVFISNNRYFDYFSKFRGLPEAINNNQFTVPPIGKKEISESLTRYLPESITNADAEKLSKEKAFLNRLLADYDSLLQKSDLNALQKLNMTLFLTLERWNAAVKTAGPDVAIDPMPYYDATENTNPMEAVISTFITDRVFKKFNDQQKKDCEILFKSLTGRGGDNQDIRRPVRLDELIKLARRGDGQQEISLSEITAIFDQFNGSNENFIQITGNSIADINSDSLLANWPQLKRWIGEESANGNVFRNLVSDALEPYLNEETQLEVPAPGTPVDQVVKPENAVILAVKWIWSSIKVFFGGKDKSEEKESKQADYLYQGASLMNATKWRDKCEPNSEWCKRYEPVEHPVLTPEQKDRLNVDYPGKTTKLEIAKHFLAWSERQYGDELAQKVREMEKARRQQKTAVQMALVAVVAMIAAGGFWLSAVNSRNNIKLIDFVEVLESNGALNTLQANRYDQMNTLIEQVVNSDNIDTRNEVINFLMVDSVGKILIAPEDPLKPLYFDALKNIGQLFDEVKTEKSTFLFGQDDSHEASLTKLDSIFNAVKANTKSGVYRQHPYLYYAINAHLNEATGAKDPVIFANIESSALAANPKYNGECAVGDKNGGLYLNSSREPLANIDGVIKSVEYAPDGSTLYAGTELGGIYQYHVGRRGEAQRIYEDTKKQKSIYFIGAYDDPNLLLVCNTIRVFFLRKTAGTFEQTSSINLDTTRITSRVWSKDRRWFIVSGKDKTTIYTLHPEQETGQITPTARIFHQGITILSTAIKMDTINGVPHTWIALGGEKGGIWIADAADPSFLTTNHTITVDENQGTGNIFSFYKNIHESSVTGLEFNPDPKIPQMASASLDGTVFLWNLQMRETQYDHIRLRNLGEGITALAYVHPQAIVAYENVSPWVIRCDINALKDYLDCKTKFKDKCKF